VNTSIIAPFIPPARVCLHTRCLVPWAGTIGMSSLKHRLSTFRDR
jgi:hypothetical protein